MRADDIFRHFFSDGDPFDDPFFSSFGFGGNPFVRQGDGRAGRGGFADMMMGGDMFSRFGDGFGMGAGGGGGFGGSSSFQSSNSTYISFGGSDGFGQGTSTSTTTYIGPDGTKTVKKVTTTRHPDGREETTTEESKTDRHGRPVLMDGSGESSQRRLKASTTSSHHGGGGVLPLASSSSHQDRDGERHRERVPCRVEEKGTPIQYDRRPQVVDLTGNDSDDTGAGTATGASARNYYQNSYISRQASVDNRREYRDTDYYNTSPRMSRK